MNQHRWGQLGCASEDWKAHQVNCKEVALENAWASTVSLGCSFVWPGHQGHLKSIKFVKPLVSHPLPDLILYGLRGPALQPGSCTSPSPATGVHVDCDWLPRLEMLLVPVSSLDRAQRYSRGESCFLLKNRC